MPMSMRMCMRMIRCGGRGSRCGIVPRGSSCGNHYRREVLLTWRKDGRFSRHCFRLCVMGSDLIILVMSMRR
jgi:hypothetical protein